MNKLCTSIEQSQKLIDLGIDINTADMLWTYDFVVDDINGLNVISEHFKPEENDVPAWSLAALLGVLPKSLIYTPNQALEGYCCKNIMYDFETYGDNPVDACVKMIIKLHEQKLL